MTQGILFLVSLRIAFCPALGVGREKFAHVKPTTYNGRNMKRIDRRRVVAHPLAPLQRPTHLRLHPMTTGTWLKRSVTGGRVESAAKFVPTGETSSNSLGAAEGLIPFVDAAVPSPQYFPIPCDIDRDTAGWRHSHRWSPNHVESLSFLR